MKKLLFIPFLISLIILGASGFAYIDTYKTNDTIDCDTIEIDSSLIVDSTIIIDTLIDTTAYREDKLSQKDYDEVAARLGVESAAIRAVVEIEAGRANKGFWAPGKPLINYDMSVIKQFAPKLGVNLSNYRNSHPEIWGASSKKYKN